MALLEELSQNLAPIRFLLKNFNSQDLNPSDNQDLQYLGDVLTKNLHTLVKAHAELDKVLKSLSSLKADRS